MHLFIGRALETSRMDQFFMIGPENLLSSEGDARRTQDVDSRRAEEERTRLICGVTPGDGQESDMSPCAESPEHGSSVKDQRYGPRLGGVKVRHRRQALQDMARPLKHWLYKHRDNPYPTKTEKVLLALGSHMTLVQVSNWFANARRRLKNTVREPNLSWALRIKLYNQCIQGNAEKLSVCSDDTGSEDEECPIQTAVSPQCDISRSSSRNMGPLDQHHGGADSTNSDGSLSPPSKYKSSLLNRYLNDSLRHVRAPHCVDVDDVAQSDRARSRLEQSFSSAEGDGDAVSPACSAEMETKFVYHVETTDCADTKCDIQRQRQRGQQGQDWGEIHAAMALTNLAQGKRSTTASTSGRSCARGPTSATMTTIVGKACTVGPTAGPWESCTVGSILSVENPRTSRIIQKSSHISEIQTVTLALANSV